MNQNKDKYPARIEREDLDVSNRSLHRILLISCRDFLLINQMTKHAIEFTYYAHDSSSSFGVQEKQRIDE